LTNGPALNLAAAVEDLASDAIFADAAERLSRL
jgi:hypothetical protein